MVFFAQKTPDFGPKNRLRIWGVPPSHPLRTKVSAKRGLRIWGVPPPPLYGQNPQSSIWPRPLASLQEKKSCLEVFEKLNFLGGMRSMWWWSIHFSLLDAGVVGGLLLQLMWGLLAQYSGELILIQGMTPPVPGQGPKSHERNTNTLEKYKYQR